MLRLAMSARLIKTKHHIKTLDNVFGRFLSTKASTEKVKAAEGSKDTTLLNKSAALVNTYKSIVDQKKSSDQWGNGEDLYNRQLSVESDQLSSAVDEYMESLAVMTTIGRATSRTTTQKVLLNWYEPLLASIEVERGVIKAARKGDKRIYGPYLEKVSDDKLAVIALNTAFNHVLKTGNGGARITSVLMDIGSEVETQSNLEMGKREINTLKRFDKDSVRGWQKDAVKDKQLLNRNHMRMLSGTLRRIAPEQHEEWSPEVKVQVGGALLDLLMKAAKLENGEPAFLREQTFNNFTRKKTGILRLDPELYSQLIVDEIKCATPRLLPMLVPPRDWDNRSYTGAYLKLRAPLMKTTGKLQREAVQLAEMEDVLVSLNYLGKTAWRINEPMLDVVEAVRKMDLRIGEIPSVVDHPLPDPETCKRLPSEIHADREAWKKHANNKYQNKPAQTAAAAAPTDMDGSSTDEASTAASTEAVDPPATEKETKRAAKAKRPVVEEVELDLSSNEPVFDERLYNEMCRRVRRKNAELHSLRCDMDIKLMVAHKFKNEVVYFPHNLDFRGRAYPIPPNLSHLGSDMCRGLLTFDQQRPLGKDGFRWLKIHLCNLYGNNKISLDERVKWTEDHIPDILDSAERPVEGKRWWATFENPFQALACCMEIKAVLESPDHEQFMSRLPVHQDGSCNGLQHYAGLGRDSKGGAAVNLVPSGSPQDVYSQVLEHVLAQIEIDRLLPEDGSDTPEPTDFSLPTDDAKTRKKKMKQLEQMKKYRGSAAKYARLVHGKINRKVIKQTVMTSVYGVTMTGARAQVQARLEEKLKEENANVIITPEVEKELFFAAHYVANLTLKSLDKMFESARGIMDWLGECSSIVSEQKETMAWVTPLGLPVMQPYRKTAQHQVKTVLQQITLTYEGDHLPVSSKKQRSAFPPNFVHSLDATHMLMTCRKMMDEGKTFAAVHDSYWTHACDIPVMNEVLRDCFIHLYEYPVLDELKDSLDMRFPEAKFPDIPARGDLDIRVVKNSQYFFH